MEFSLIALDLDGTALQADHVSFSPRLSAALLAAHRRGVAVVPITGRQFAMLPPAVPTGAEWEDLCVLCNGSEVRRLADGALLDSHYMAAPLILALIDLAWRLDLPVELSAGGRLYLTGTDWERLRGIGGPLAFHLNTILSARGRAGPDLTALCREERLCFDTVNLPYLPPERRAEVEAALSALPLSFAWSSPRSIEITHREATKAQGLLRACSLLGVDSARTLAIGDSGNDIPMLRAAGLGVAMGNAPQEVRDAAGAVTLSNAEDGAAAAVERYVLKAAR